MGYTAGQKVKLSGAYLYASSTASSRSGTVSGTYYIWSASVVNGRIRITSRSSYVGKTPAGTYVTGWVKTSAIPSASSGSLAKTTTSSSNKKSSIEIRYLDPSTVTATLVSATPAPKTTSIISDVAASDVTPTAVVPGQIGYLGKVIFLVTEKQIKTIQNFTLEASAKYATHDRHLRGTMVEFTGIDAQVLNIDILLSAYLGTAPMADYITLMNYMEAGTAIPFKLGSKSYGHYRWVIEKISFVGQYTDKDANWTQAKVSVSLREYIKR